MTRLSRDYTPWSLPDYCASWHDELRETGVRMPKSLTQHGFQTIYLRRPRHGSEPALSMTFTALNNASQRRMLVRVRMSQISLLCIEEGACMGLSVAKRADRAAADMLEAYPMMADTLRRLATAARAWHRRYSGGETSQKTVDALLQTSDTRRALSVSVRDPLLTCGVGDSHAVQLGLDLR